MLIRQPNVTTPPNDFASLDDDGIPLSFNQYELQGTQNFYTDFDYASFFDGAGVRFHGASSLNWCSSVFSLTSPAYRFGFDNTSQSGGGYGLPREYVGTTFIGPLHARRNVAPQFQLPGSLQYQFSQTAEPRQDVGSRQWGRV